MALKAAAPLAGSAFFVDGPGGAVAGPTGPVAGSAVPGTAYRRSSAVPPPSGWLGYPRK